MADFIGEIKRQSSKWIKTKSKSLADFRWQNGYGVSSISPAHVEPLQVYIANQERHHRRETFKEEYRRLLTKYEIDDDERYVWDGLDGAPLRGRVATRGIGCAARGRCALR